MEATALVPLGMGLIVVGAGMGIGRLPLPPQRVLLDNRSS